MPHWPGGDRDPNSAVGAVGRAPATPRRPRHYTEEGDAHFGLSPALEKQGGDGHYEDNTVVNGLRSRKQK